MSPEPIVLEIKKPKTASSQSRKKLARIAAKKISNKYKRLLWTIKVFKKAKTLFNNLKTDPASVIFAEEFLDNKLLKKLKKLHHDVDKQLFKLVNLADSKNFLDNGKSPTRTDYVEKREIDRSTLYSFDGPFQFLHTDVGNI